MFVRILIFIGFILAEIFVCKCDSGCPNAPVTPLPTLQPSAVYPNVPGTVKPTKASIEPTTGCPSGPVTPLPTLKPSMQLLSTPVAADTIKAPVESLTSPTTGCPNEPVTPLPTVKPSTKLPSKSAASDTVKAPVELLTSPTTGCPNEPVTPLPTVKPSTEYPSMPVAANLTKAPAEPVTSSTTSPQHIFGCENQSTSQAMNAVSQCCLQLLCQSFCSTGIETTTLPPKSTTSPAPPEALIKCPPGTVLLGRRCHLLYCPRGSQMINGRCIVIECPVGTVWTGTSCSLPEPIVQNIKFQSTIVTHFNQTKPQIVLNNTNNIFVDASLSLHIDDEYENGNDDENSDYKDTTEEAVPERVPSSSCCELVTPRICKQYNNRWHCYSRRSRRCGEFCVAPTIYLKPSRIYATPGYTVMPPMQNNCHLYGNCGHLTGQYDCSGCGFNYMEHCSSYCYRYTCPPLRCDYYDQEKYCAKNIGFYGCREEDGWWPA